MALLTIAAACFAACSADALAERVDRYRIAEGIEARGAALELVAALAGTPAGPEPAALCLALAEGLTDEHHAVRARAVELVAKAGAPSVAAEQLLVATAAQVELEREIQEQVRSFDPGEMGDLFAKNKKDREKALEDIKRMSEAAKEMAEYLRGYVDVPKVRDALVVAWPRLRDDRAVEGLTLLFEDAGFGERADGVVDGLLAIGTAPALDALTEHVVRYEGARKERDARGRKLSRERPRKKPSELWANDVWRKHERERIEKLRADFDLHAADQDAWMETFTDRLRAFGEAAGLGKPPRGLKPAGGWTNWSTKARDVLPASVEGG